MSIYAFVMQKSLQRNSFCLYLKSSHYLSRFRKYFQSRQLFRRLFRRLFHFQRFLLFYLHLSSLFYLQHQKSKYFEQKLHQNQ